MNSRARIIRGGAGAGGVRPPPFMGLKLYVPPRTARRSALDAQRTKSASFTSELGKRGRVRDELKRIASTTLSAQADGATASFRTWLGKLGNECGLAVS